MNRMPYQLIALVFLLPAVLWAGEGVSVSLSVQAVRIQDAVTAKLSNKAQWVFIAGEVESGKTIVSAGSAGDTAFVPGSLMKLFISGAALEKNSKVPFDLSAVVATEGKIKRGTLTGNVIIRGGGNALLSTKDLNVAVEKLKARGIARINGDIIADDSLFDVKGWKASYSGPAYGVPSALGLDLHTVSITAEGSTQRVLIDPPNDAVKVSFSPSGKPGVRQIDDLTYEMTGAVPDAPVVRSRFLLADPALYAGGTFLTLLRKAGVEITGSVKRRTSPSPQPSPSRGEGDRRFAEIARIGSQDINAFIRDTNQESLNAAADNLLFLLGSSTSGAPGTREHGIQAVNDFLGEVGMPLDGLVIDDGSGVSERNRVSAQQIVTFLRVVAKKSWFNSFYESLSRPGMDGRLRDSGYRSDRMRAKLGQVHNAYCLAGYVDQRNGGRTAFAFMVNGPDANTPAASNAAVEVLKQLEQ